jgi:DNA-binding NtrC family response regulator
VVTLHLPRLVERGEDLDLLAQHFAAHFAARYGRPLRAVSREVFEILHRHDWPGNVRELQNVMERAVLLSHGSILRPEHLPLEQMAPADGPGEGGGPLAGYPPTLSAAEVERLHIRAVLRSVGGHMGRASEILGLHRNTLTRKVRDYGLEGVAP